MITPDDFLQWCYVFGVLTGQKRTAIPQNNLLVWLDAADPLANGTVPADNTAQSIWYDKSGNSNNANFIQNGGANNFHLNQVNSLPIMQNTAANSQFYQLPNGILSGMAGVTIYYVYQLTTALVTSAPLFDFGTSSGNYMNYSPEGAGDTGKIFKIFDSANAGTVTYSTSVPAALESVYLDTITYNFASSQQTIRVDGNAALLSSSQTGGLAYPSDIGSMVNAYLCKSNSGAGTPTVQLCEIIIYDGVQTASQIAQVESYLSHKWGIVPPAVVDWNNWSGSGNQDFQNLGARYNTGSFEQTIATVRIDANRFLLIYGGLGTTFSAVVGTVTSEDSAPTYGTPVLIDAALDSTSVTFDCVNIYGDNATQFLGFITYFQPNNASETIYGNLISISGSSLTLHTRATLATSAGGNFPSRSLGVLLEGSVVGMLYETTDATVNAITIDPVAFTMTLGTPIVITGFFADFGFASACGFSSPSIFAIIIPDNAQSQLVINTFTISSGNLVTADSKIVDNTLTLSTSGVSIIQVNDFQGILAYSGAGITTNDNLLNIRQFTIDGLGNITQDGVQTVIEFPAADNVLGSFPFPYSMMRLNNSLQQVLLTMNWLPPVGSAWGQTMFCLTPNTGSPVQIGNGVDINANNNGASISNGGIGNGCALTSTLAILPVTCFDGSNYGLKVLNYVNDLSIPYQIFKVEAEFNATTTPSASLGNASGTMGGNTLTVSGVDLTKYLTNYCNITIGGTTYHSSNIALSGSDTVITTDSALTNNYSSQPLTVTEVTNITDTTSNAYVFSTVDNAHAPLLGFLNGHATLCNWFNDTTSALSSLISTAMNFDVNSECTLFIGVGPMNTGIGGGVTSSTADNMGNQINVQTNQVQISTGGFSVVGGYTLTALTLITLVRSILGSRVYINGVLNATANVVVTPIGNNLIFSLGNGLSAAISFCELWNGALGNTERSAIEAAYISKYSIT